MHKVHLNNQAKVFKQITHISSIDEWAELEDNYMIVVKSRIPNHTFELWVTDDKVQGLGDLVYYYQIFHNRWINEEDIQILEKEDN